MARLPAPVEPPAPTPAEIESAAREPRGAIEVPIADKIAWSVDEVAAMTGISRRHIYVLIARDGFPPPRRIGRRSIWLPADVRAWIEKQRPE